MKHNRAFEVLFVAGFGPIVREATASRKLYGQALGIDFTKEAGGNCRAYFPAAASASSTESYRTTLVTRSSLTTNTVAMRRVLAVPLGRFHVARCSAMTQPFAG